MLHWNKEKYFRDGRPSFHVHSSLYSRIQLLEIPYGQDRGLFCNELGEVLINVISGAGQLYIKSECHDINEYDHILIQEGDEFKIINLSPEIELILQMAWLPGPNSCTQGESH